MKRNTCRILLIILTVLYLAVFAFPQTNKKDEKAVAEIMDLRKKTVEAIEKRDRQMLDEIYAEGFTHTHAIGRVDDKKKRLDVFVSGDKTIDTATPDELKIKIFGDKTAIANGKSSVPNDDGIIITYRWIVVYAQIGKKWQIVASQATKLSE